jgi:hypothetical protein
LILLDSTVIVGFLDADWPKVAGLDCRIELLTACP